MTNYVRKSIKSLFELVEKQHCIDSLIKEKTNQIGADENPFFIGDLGDIIRKHKIWQKSFPTVVPFYAVKCNDFYPVLRLMADMGLSFDCASKIEIQKILDLGVDPTRIIYANPYKQISFLKYAADYDVAMMTFDCDDELEKIKEVYPAAKLVLRICPQTNHKVKHPLKRKFGCHPFKASQLLKYAKELTLNVIGVSFHVGSGCQEAEAYRAATEESRYVFDIGLAMGFDMTLLNIGGGYPGRSVPNDKNTFKEISTVVNKSLDKYFNGNDVRIIAEPGQFYVSSAFTIATNIISKKIVDKEIENITPVSDGELHGFTDTLYKQIRMYYVNDGIYGCFFDCLLYPGWFVPSHFKDDDEKVYDSAIWGPTCDAVDLIIENINLPDLKRGEWIYFKNMGAYAFQCVTSFNSMPKVKEYFICERVLLEEIYPLEQSRLIKTTQGE
ncbi:ornithine decarboxylase-like [Mytilus galloprovincialis]|uniref:ornithine decarboxylase-like n=1 Tax=Mytilus galloprovincialis TaxID=29158 RepID=UPI003F7C0DDD